MKKTFSLLLSLFLLFPMVILAEDWSNSTEEECKGVKLNTNVPFVWKCIEFGSGTADSSDTTKVNQVNAFPKLMAALMNIVMTASLIIGFVMILAGGVMMTTGGFEAGNFKKGKEMIIRVWTVLALIGLSGIILKLINPSFFT